MTLWGRRILMIVAVCIEIFLANSPLSYNVFFTELQSEFEQTALIISWVGALGSGLLCLGSPLTAIIGSKIGSFRLLLLGISLHCAGYLAFSFSPTIAYCFVTYSITGLGSCCMISAGGSFMLEWVSGQKNLCAVTTACTLGASLAVMIQGPILTILSAALGWRNCCRILSGFCLVVGFLAGLPFSFSPKHRQLQQSSDKIGTSKVNNGHVLLNVEVWLWTTSITLSQFGWSFVIINYSSFLDGMGLETDQKSVALTTIGAAEVGARILFAVFGDHVPFFKLYAIAASSTIAAIVSAFLMISSSFEHLIVLSLVWGLLRGISYGASFAAAAELFSSLGTHSVTTLALFGYGLGVILGASVTGALYDLTGNYALSLVVLAAIFCMSAVSMVIIPIKRRLQAKCFTSVKSDTYRYQNANSAEQTEVEAVAV